MAKLTTKELEVVTNSIYIKVEEKIKQFKTTEDYNLLVEKIKEQLKYTEILSLIQDYKNILKEIEVLNLTKGEVIVKIRALRNDRLSTIPYEEYTLDNIINNAVSKEINKLYPTKKDIETDIILLSISGSNNIIYSIINKYNLFDE